MPYQQKWLARPLGWVAAALLLPAVAAAQPAAPATQLPLDPAVRTGHLPNGLTYYIRRNATPAREARLVLANRAGALLEDEDQRGLAHFVEHMAFNGTRDFPKHELISTLQRAGVRFGADLNAYTTQDETVYELPLPTNQPGLLRQGMQILANWAAHLTLDEQEIAQERGIILEEARARGQNADERVRQQAAPVLLNHARVNEREAIGLTKVVRTAPAARLRQFYHDWYRPDLQAVIAVGDFDPDEVERYLHEYFTELRNPVPERPLPSYAVPTRSDTEVRLITDLGLTTTQAYSVVRQAAAPPGTAAALQEYVAHQLFTYLLQQRLAALRRQPQPPFQAADVSFGLLTTGVTALGLSVTVARLPEVPAALAAVLGQLEQVRRQGFAPAEVAQAKRVLTGRLDSQWQQRDQVASEAYASEYTQLFLHGTAAPGLAFERDFILHYLGELTGGQLSALATGFEQPANRALILQAPAAQQAQLPDAATLTAWFAPPAAPSAIAGTPAPADSLGAARPLVAAPPMGGRIIHERRWPAGGATELRLSNGVRVLLKPTALQRNEVLLGSYGFGGTSRASDAGFTAAAMSVPLVLASGVGAWPAPSLSQRLAGHDVRVVPAMGELTQGWQGHCSPAELETALQLVYLYATQPRFDSLAWATLRSRALAAIASRSPEPERVFLDTVASVLNGGSFRRLSPTAARVQAAQFEAAAAYYRARLGNAAGHTFILVGSFDSATVRPLVARYLGALPARPGRAGTFRNLRQLPPPGPLTKVVRVGHDDKATVQLVFQGRYRYSLARNLELRVLQDLLELRLLARLREQEGGVYSPSVQASATRLPTSRFALTVRFDCAPANADKLAAAALAEIHTLATHGPDPDDWAKVLAEQRADYARQGSTNGFWLSYLLRQSQHAAPLGDYRAEPRRLAALTPAAARRAARRYCSPRHLLRFELLPAPAQP